MARITIVTDDIDVRMASLSALDRKHEVRAAGARELLSGGALLSGGPDVIVVDAGVEADRVLGDLQALFEEGFEQRFSDAVRRVEPSGGTACKSAVDALSPALEA